MFREYHERESEKFNKEECAYIHIEVWDGRPQIYFAGDALAMLYGLMNTINNISFETENTFEDSIDAIQTLHDDMIRGLTE